MSDINIHKVETTETPDGSLMLPDLGGHNEVHSLRDGEELMAAAKLLALLDDLGEGEAIVVWKNVF